MKKYNITVNGKTYEVEVEEIGGSVQTAPQVVPKVNPVPVIKEAAPAPVPVPAAPAPQAPSAASVSGESVVAPLPGKIIKVVSGTGTPVKSGDVVVILEAMKMENEITAPVDGTVKQVSVSEGATVNPGDVLFVIG